MVRLNIGFPAPVWWKFEQLCEKEGLATAPKVRSIIIQWVMQHDDAEEDGATAPRPPLPIEKRPVHSQMNPGPSKSPPAQRANRAIEQPERRLLHIAEMRQWTI